MGFTEGDSGYDQAPRVLSGVHGFANLVLVFVGIRDLDSAFPRQVQEVSL